MANSNDARTEILRRIRNANDRTATSDDALREWHKIPRHYNHGGKMQRGPLLERLIHRLRDYDAVVELSPLADVPTVLATKLMGLGNPHMLIAADFTLSLVPSQTDFTVDDHFTPPQLDRYEGILTEATLAIAETGTIVLQNAPGQGRRAPTLVPDLHICIVRASQVVESVPQAMARLGPTSTLPTTFISGPSATADIEMTRIKGVHGPRFLHVVVAED